METVRMDMRKIFAIAATILMGLTISAFGSELKNPCFSASSPPPPPNSPGVAADYVRLAYGDGKFFSRPSYRIFSGGMLGIDDELFPIMFCPKTSKFICIYSNYNELAFVFAFPRRDIKAGDKWRFGEAEFALIQNATLVIPSGTLEDTGNPLSQIELLGVSLKTYIIARLDPKTYKPTTLFFYSPDRGLIGETDPNVGDYLTINWLAEPDGPGSNSFDSKIPTDRLIDNKDMAMLAEGKPIHTCF